MKISVHEITLAAAWWDTQNGGTISVWDTDSASRFESGPAS